MLVRLSSLNLTDVEMSQVIGQVSRDGTTGGVLPSLSSSFFGFITLRCKVWYHECLSPFILQLQRHTKNTELLSRD